MSPFGEPPLFRLIVEVAAPVALDSASGGPLRLVRILGGRVEGALAGRILPGGTDWQTVTADGSTHIEARYLLELNDGARVELRSLGQRAPDASGFWSPIWLRAHAAGHVGLNRRQYLGYGRKEAGQVVIDVFVLPDP